MKRNFKISEEESEAVVKGLEQGMGEHIKRQQISRRGFIKAMAGLGAMATTLTLPTGTPTLKEAVKLPWVGLPDKAGGGIGARKVEKIEDLYPVDTSVYKRFNYDEQMTEYPAYYQSKGLDYATYPTMTDNAKKNYEAGVSGFSQLDIAFHRASWTYNSLIRDHQTLRGVPGGPTYSSGSWVPLFPAQGRHPYLQGKKYEFDSPAQASKYVKKVARFYQADLVGICELDKRWVFGRQMMKDIVFENVDQPYETDEKCVIPEKCKYVVVMGVESERENFKCYTPEGRTSELVEASVGLGYSRQAIAHTFVAEFLRNLGYLAIPHANDTSFTGINMAAAGIANIGRMGIATCPEYGPQIRGSKVFTDLPMEPDKIIDLGLNEFCAVCKKCNRYCPGGSIPDGPRTWESQTAHSYNNPGVFKWYVCHSECRKQWNDSGTACAMCITSCPWGKGPGWFHDVARWSSANIPALDSFWVWLDDAMGYGARIDAKEYWENHPVTWHHGTRANFQRMRPNHEP